MEAINSEGPRLAEKVSATVSAVVEHMLGWLAYIPWLIPDSDPEFLLLKRR